MVSGRVEVVAPELNRLPLRGLLIAWGFGLGVINAGLIGPNRSSVQREYGLSSGEFGLGVAGVQIGCAIALLLVAAWSQGRFSNAWSLIVGLSAQAIGFGLICLTRGVGWLATGWALITLGALLGGVSNNLSAHLWPGDRRRGVSLLHGFNALGKMCGPLVAAAVLAFAWRTSFAAVGVFTLAVWLAAFACKKGFEAVEEQAALEVEPSNERETGMRGLLQPFYWLTVLPFGLIAGGDVAFATLAPLFYEQRFDLTPRNASLLLALHLVGMASGRFAFAAVGRKWNNNQIIGACLSAGVCIFPAALSPQPIVRALALFGLGWMFSSTWPTFYNQVARFHQGREQMLALGSSTSNVLGIALCVGLSSALADRYPIAALCLGPAALWLFGLIYFCSGLSKGEAVLKVAEGR